MSFKCFTIPDARIEIKKSQCSGVFVSYSELLDTLWKSAWKFVSLNFTSKSGFCADDGAGASADWNVHFHTESLIVFPLFFFFYCRFCETFVKVYSSWVAMDVRVSFIRLKQKIISFFFVVLFCFGLSCLRENNKSQQNFLWPFTWYCDVWTQSTPQRLRQYLLLFSVLFCYFFSLSRYSYLRILSTPVIINQNRRSPNKPSNTHWLTAVPEPI